MPYVAQVRDGRGLLTGIVSAERAADLVAEHPSAMVIEAPDRAQAFRLAHEHAEELLWRARELAQHPEVTPAQADAAIAAVRALHLAGAVS